MFTIERITNGFLRYDNKFTSANNAISYILQLCSSDKYNIYYDSIPICQMTKYSDNDFVIYFLDEDGTVEGYPLTN